MSDENNREISNNNDESKNEINTENEPVEEIKNQEDKKSSVLKFVLIISAVFAGVFLATYAVVDRCMYRMGIMPFVVSMEKAQKTFDREMNYVEKNSPAPVKIEQKDNEAVVTVDLKKFDNNEDNVNIEFTDNGIKISGKVRKENKNGISESSFAQNVIFPNEFQKENIQKNKKGNKLVIILPFKK